MLTNTQERQVFRQVNGKTSWQYGFDSGLWTGNSPRQIVGDPITQRFGVTPSLASAGALLARVGVTPQKPLQRAYQRDPETITHCFCPCVTSIACEYNLNPSNPGSRAYHDKFGSKRRRPEETPIPRIRIMIRQSHHERNRP